MFYSKLTITRNFDIGSDYASRERTAPVLKTLLEQGKLIQVQRTEVVPYPDSEGRYSYYRLFDSESSARDYLQHCFDDDRANYPLPTIVDYKIEQVPATL